LLWGKHWLLVGFALCAVNGAAQPPSPAPQAPATQRPAAQKPAQDAPDDEFIEFLGSDDVGDAAWWEFLKKAPPRRGNPPAPPPQDAKQ
jgi:hypothetical protein